MQETQKKRVLLQVDYLTNKIYGAEEYDGDGKGVDFTVENDAMIEQAEADGYDLFYIDGKIIKKKKDVNEYRNKLKRLGEELRQSNELKEVAFVDYFRAKSDFDIAERLSAISDVKKDIRNRISNLKEDYYQAIKNKVYEKIRTADFKYYCSVCMIIKDDNEYLEEWLNWHVGQGVEHFYIYDHGSKQPVSEFMQTLTQELREKVTLTDFGGSHKFAQHDAYNDCLKKYAGESRWIGFIDSDEMVRVKEKETLPDFLKRFENYAGLFIGWIIYDANGRVCKSAEPVRERFTRKTAYNGQDGVGKVFVQPYMISQMLTHNGYALDGFTVVDENYKTVESGQAWKYDLTCERICIDHYYTKSYEEWIEKMKRGSCDPYYNRKYEEFFKYNPEMEKCREKEFPVQKYEGIKEIKIKGEKQ